MSPGTVSVEPPKTGVPRASGDEPGGENQHRRGAIRVPRASGDEPVVKPYALPFSVCSPRERG